MERMTTRLVVPGRPEAGEYAEFYAKYVSLVPGTDVLGALEAQRLVMAQLLGARSEREGNFRYAPDKWTVKEVIGHLADSERIFAYRALRFARGDQTALSGFEQDDYVKGGGFSERTLADLADEFAEVRGASIALFNGLDAAAWQKRGVANKSEITVRALAYIIAGHDLHHRRVLEEKYLPAIPRA
jgi:DinB superfamily